ncbi:MAG TPA: hypothetical protein VE076_09655 [Nitrososphaeraceae archaeon]|nr:hypothetical protein [Nitrososphaeraceae archaeon]
MRWILKNTSFSLLFRFAFVIVIVSAAVWIGRSDFSEGQQLKMAKSLGLKIISPTHNQTVPVGSGFKILGSSIATDVQNCYVSIIVNNIKPYQNATASGPIGINDYSKWNFTLLPDKYNPIKEGQNKITSKLSCLNGNNNTNSNSITNSTNLTKWYSVNVTGVTMPSKANNTQTTTNTAMIQQPIITTGHNGVKTTMYNRNTTTSSSKILKGNNNELTVPQILPSTASSAPPSTSKTNNNINNINKVKPLSISVQSSQNIVNGKGKSTITAIAYDATSGKKIDNAVVKLKITFTSNGTTKMISGDKGEVTYSVDIKPDSNSNNSHGSGGNGNFTTTVQASAPGYTSAYKTTTAMAFSHSSSSSTSSSSSSSNISDLTDNIIKDVKKKIIESTLE